MTLKAGMQAPTFTGETKDGDAISLDSFQGKNVLLKFFRYSSCPICNLRVQEFNDAGKELANAGITTLLIFHSSKESLNNNLKAINSYTIIADPDKHIFNLYQVGKSWLGIIAPGMMPAYVKATVKGFFSPKLFGNEGGDAGMPADFLIDGEGVIQYAHYGKHASDSISAQDTLKISQELGLAQV